MKLQYRTFPLGYQSECVIFLDSKTTICDNEADTSADWFLGHELVYDLQEF